jgi:hypothetical protein
MLQENTLPGAESRGKHQHDGPDTDKESHTDHKGECGSWIHFRKRRYVHVPHQAQQFVTQRPYGFHC